MLQKLRDKIEQRREKGTFRSLSSFEGKIDFMSNDFLGLAQCEYSLHGKPASGGSRLMTGNSRQLEQIEKEIASFFGSEHGLLFNSGYLANLALFSCIPDKRTIVFFDKEIHASVRDGLRMSDCRSIGFKHNDLVDLKRLLQNCSKENQSDLILVAVEGLYSMSGECAPLIELVELCEAFGAHLIVDEAHSAGIYGNSGRGLVEELDLIDRIPIRLITFGKAYGAHGAIVLSNDPLVRDYLINFARPLIYTTAISENEAFRILNSIQDSQVNVRREQLMFNLELYHNLYRGDRISDNRSPIQVVRGRQEELENLVKELSVQNISTKLIKEPTVPKGKECIRLVIHSFNSEAEIRKLVSIIEA